MATSTRPLRVGVQLPEVEREVRWPEYVEMARRAEAVGFDSLWLGDHLLYRYDDGSTRGPWEMWTMLAALAASTSRIRLGSLVASTAFHAPAMLAKLATTVDEVSGGRLILGLGAGWNEPEFRAFGFPFDHRIDRFEEAFTIVRTLLQDGAIDFDGRYFQARDAELLPRPSRPGGPPLLIGSIGPRMLRITLPHVQAWNVWYADTANTPAGLEPHLGLVDGISRGGRSRPIGDRTDRRGARPAAGGSWPKIAVLVVDAAEAAHRIIRRDRRRSPCLCPARRRGGPARRRSDHHRVHRGAGAGARGPRAGLIGADRG